jgi:hypothetical protein
MSHRGNGYGNNRVNIRKKIKVGEICDFYPAVVENRTVNSATKS